MPPVPLLRPAEVVRAIEQFGLSVARERGSHILTTPGHPRPAGAVDEADAKGPVQKVSVV